MTICYNKDAQQIANIQTTSRSKDKKNSYTLTILCALLKHEQVFIFTEIAELSSKFEHRG